MTDRHRTPDADLDRWRELESSQGSESAELLERMFCDVKQQCDRSDHTLTGFLRSRSTTVRRSIVLAVFAALAIVGWHLFPLIDERARSTGWFLSLTGFALLVVLAMYAVTRPVHLPALPRWKAWLLIAATLAATVLAAFWPLPTAQGDPHAEGVGVMAGVCMGVGLLLGVPVYALLRLVDRGNPLGNLLAAAAAGVAANFVLKAHCPVPGTAHELFGHASVAVLFVLGLGLVHRLIPSRKPR